MRHIRLFPLFVLLACGSTEEGKEQKISFDNFVFSFDGHSMKFTQQDTIFIRRRNVPPDELLYSIISKKDKAAINRFVDSIYFAKYDSIYIEHHLQDGDEYKFYITKGKSITSVYIYGRKGPRRLRSFATWLQHLEHRYNFQSINTNKNFGNLNHVILSPLPPPPFIKHENHY